MEKIVYKGHGLLVPNRATKKPVDSRSVITMKGQKDKMPVGKTILIVQESEDGHLTFGIQPPSPR